jgi:uncharacterized phage-associated protein
MAYDSRAVANYFLDSAEDSGTTINHLKLQKLVYFAHGWHLGLVKQPLIDEQVEAWKFGPIVRTIFDSFKMFGGSEPIDRKADRLVRGKWGRGCLQDYSLDDVNQCEQTQLEFTKTLLDRIWQVHGRLYSAELSAAAHAIGTPWHEVNEEYNGQIPRGTDIPTRAIREYFTRLAEMPSSPDKVIQVRTFEIPPKVQEEISRGLKMGRDAAN